MRLCANTFEEVKQSSGGLVLWWENTAGPKTEERTIRCSFWECGMGKKKTTFFAGMGFQVIETDLILIYTKFRIFQWDPTEVLGKHPAAQVVAEYTKPESTLSGESNRGSITRKSIFYFLNMTQ